LDEDASLDTILDDLEPVLVELANQPGDLDRNEIIRLRKELNTSGLLFEIRVLRSRVREDEPNGGIARQNGTVWYERIEGHCRFVCRCYAGDIAGVGLGCAAVCGGRSAIDSAAVDGAAGSGRDGAADDSHYGRRQRRGQLLRWNTRYSGESLGGCRIDLRGNRGASWRTRGGRTLLEGIAENKQGKTDAALKACAELRQRYSKSRWIDDCGALEIETRGRNGPPVDPQSEHDESLKLLALNALMHRNESKALPLIEQILAGDQPEAFKENTLFEQAQSQSKQAQKMLANVANPMSESLAAIQANTALQERAQQLLTAAQPRPAQEPKVRRLGVDVVVTNTQGKPVTGLEAQDFTSFDKGHPQ
jgi:hypothetical protein